MLALSMSTSLFLYTKSARKIRNPIYQSDNNINFCTLLERLLAALLFTAYLILSFVSTRLTNETNEQLGRKESELDHINRENQDLRREVHVLKEEVEALKDSNQRGPTASMKAMVERLKNQLALKEKQHQVCWEIKPHNL